MELYDLAALLRHRISDAEVAVEELSDLRKTLDKEAGRNEKLMLALDAIIEAKDRWLMAGPRAGDLATLMAAIDAADKLKNNPDPEPVDPRRKAGASVVSGYLAENGRIEPFSRG